MNARKLVSALALAALLLTPVTVSAGSDSFGAPFIPPQQVDMLIWMALVSYGFLISVGGVLVLTSPFLLLAFVVRKFERSRRRRTRDRDADPEGQDLEVADSGAEESPGLVEELPDR